MSLEKNGLMVQLARVPVYLHKCLGFKMYYEQKAWEYSPMVLQILACLCAISGLMGVHGSPSDSIGVQ